MPELPEVETICRQLAPLVEGRTFAKVSILDPRWAVGTSPGALAAALRRRRVERLRRRGKYLVWELDGGRFLLQHLRMSGVVLYEPDRIPRHTRVRIELQADAPGAGRPSGTPGRRGPAASGSERAGPAAKGGGPDGRAASNPERGGSASGSPESGRGGSESPDRGGREAGRPAQARSLIVVADQRRFGTAQLVTGAAELEQFFAARLGPEPFDEAFSPACLRAAARRRRAPVKALLLDQRVVAGVGNIYADEALYRACIHPARAAGALTLAQCRRLRDAVREALTEGIAARGASIEDFRHVDGVRGTFQDRFLVHRRAGESCGRCGRTIVRLLVAGRATYACDRCQPRPRQRRSQSGAQRGRRRAAAGLPEPLSSAGVG